MDELTLTLFIISMVVGIGGGAAFLYVAIKTVHTSNEFGKMGKTLNATTVLIRENARRQDRAKMKMSKEIESLKNRIEKLEGVQSGKP